MSRDGNICLAEQLLAGIGQGADPLAIAALFAVDVDFEVAGDAGALPWIGKTRGRAAVADFIDGLRTLTELRRFDVQDLLASEQRAVIVGELASTIKATGRLVETAFALVLTIAGGEITRFQMLEDSFAVSRAAR